MLGNLYRTGADSMGWHSDDEPKLGPAPVLASLSFGATRRFVVRRKDDKSRKIDVPLPGNSLLIMRGATQANWQHAIPKTRKPVGPRINLTFRKMHPVA
jgi:alkylated DNA repair dioxygenase AlkB